MNKIIENVIYDTFEIFIDELDHRGCLCDAKDFRYNNGVIPDYNDRFIQAFYLLRYFPAYLAEYYQIYKEFLEESYSGNPFRVVSVGCGCGLDYYGLELALREHGTSCSDKVYYTGIDLIDWIAKNDFQNQDFSFQNLNILKVKDIWKIQNKTPDVIIFPKSIGEFSDKGFGKLLNLFGRSIFKKPKISIISSLRKQHLNIDQERMKNLLELMEKEHNYKCNIDKTTYTYFTDNVGLRKYYYDFIYPQDVLDYINRLHNSCPTKIKNGDFCEDDCEEILSQKSPIMRTEHIRYQIFDLTR